MAVALSEWCCFTASEKVVFFLECEEGDLQLEKLSEKVCDSIIITPRAKPAAVKQG